MKIFRIHFTLLTLAVIAASCSEDFIDLSPLDQANTENSFNNPDDINLAVLGIYDALQSNSYAQDMAILTELISDDGTIQPSRIGDNDKQYLREMENFQITSGNTYLLGRWRALYVGIARSNFVLEKINDVSFPDPELKAQYVGEAKFLRALFYFDLVRFFGEVPLSTSVISTVEEAFSLKRASTSEVFAVIESDLTDAELSLPVSYSSSNLGRATQGAAKALLAKVYLTEGKEDMAISLLRELTGGSYSYQLMPSYSEVFNADNTSESLFEVQYSSAVVGEGNAYPNFFFSNDGSIGSDIYGGGYLGGSGNGICLATQEFVDSYPANDARKDYTILRYYSNQESDSLNIVFKYRDAPTSPNNSEDNIPLLRYADVLLMLAEAINEQNGGPTTEAYDLVDQIRSRSGVAGITRDKDYESFKFALLDERRWEFAFENQRWFDLKRMGKLVEVLYGKGYGIESYHVLYPVPLLEIQINPNNLTQNPGY